MNKQIIFTHLVFPLCFAFIFIFFFSTPSYSGLLFHESNLDIFGYKDPACYQPYISRPLTQADINAINDYSNRIEKYLKALTNDLNYIQEKGNSVVRDYSNFIQSLP